MYDDVHLDLESRSRLDLDDVGAARYAADPTTDLFMAAVSGPNDGDPVYLWINPKFEDAGVWSDPEALALLRSAKRVHAFSVQFEQAMWDGLGMSPPITLDKWRCTQAMARIAGLPASLADCAETIFNPIKVMPATSNRYKDPRGRALIKFFCEPNEDGVFNEPKDHPVEWLAFCNYCRQDVVAERSIRLELKSHFDLVDENLATFQFTLRMNDTGVPVNVPALRNAQVIANQVAGKAKAEFLRITGLKITQRAKVRVWFAMEGVELDNMQADTLQNTDLTGWPDAVQRALDLYCQLSYSAVKKIKTMLDWVCPDGRLHGVFTHYGAGTGRWSARGPQVHNAKKATPAMKALTPAIYKYICEGGCAEGIDAVYGDVIECLASCIRHFIGEPGSELLDGDYNAVEARILNWMAGQQNIINMFKRGDDIYRFMAAQVYRKTPSQITSNERDIGKRVELGCGYGMGIDKFMDTCRIYKVPCTRGLAEMAVMAYRESHPYVVRWWRALESAARYAVQNQGSPIDNFIVQTVAGIPFLFIHLPSGRRLAYPYPQLNPDPKWGTQLTYWGQLPGTVVWGRVKLYGGKLAENIVQAIAADVMSYGARVAESRWMLPVALIHDQGLAVRQAGQTAAAFAAALGSLPPWAVGLPLKVEAHIAPYYSK